jgi:ABC-type transporter lipoprotein component MlaA
MNVRRFACLALLLTAGCGTLPTQRNDWTKYDGPGKEHFVAEEVEFPMVDDPYESWNRPVGAFNYGFLVYVIDPLGDVYHWFVPESFREAITRAGSNLQYPTRAINDGLQGRGTDMRDETGRFLINSTVGLLGFFDPATHWFGLPAPPPAEFGQTFTEWGWDESAPLSLPFLGPRNVRDSAAVPPDFATDIATYITGVTAFRTFNDKSEITEDVKRFVREHPDAYEKGKVLLGIGRDREVFGPAQIVGETPAADDTIQFIFFRPEDEVLVESVEVNEVQIASTGREMPYSAWMQPEPAPIIYYVPGLAGHRDAASTLAFAERAFRRGYSFAAVSSAMNHEFMASASTQKVPGYAPVDADDLHAALDAIDRDLAERYPGRVTKRVLMGASLGAFHTLFVAAAQVTPHPERVRFDRFIALNPPISLLYGMQQLDDYYNAPLVYPKEERAQRVDQILRKAADLLSPRARPEDTRKYGDVASRFLIGANYRLNLGDLILASQLRNDMGVLKTPLDTTRKNHAYREIREFSWVEYAYAFILPALRERYPELDTLDEVFERCDLRSLAWRLGHCETTHVLTSVDDFLLRDGDHQEEVQEDIFGVLWNLRFQR